MLSVILSIILLLLFSFAVAGAASFQIDAYTGAGQDIYKTLTQGLDVKNKHVLVIGSQSPWVEAYLLFQ